MPLHLLGKKSWNVYNQANIDRVRRDEAEAAAREAAEDERIQQRLAARRLAILRGEELPKSPSPPLSLTSESKSHPKKDRDRLSNRESKKRRRPLRGEDDTDRDIRLAREDVAAGERAREEFRVVKPAIDTTGEIDLVNERGHIQLIPDAAVDGDEDKSRPSCNKRQRRDKDGPDAAAPAEVEGMKFADAAGYKTTASRLPWYAAPSHQHSADPSATWTTMAETKDVWGMEDPRRREREMCRVVGNDPFAMMQRAQRQLKQSERDREKWIKQREQDERQNGRSGRDGGRRGYERDKDGRKRRPREREKEEDEGLEGFSLDAKQPEGKEKIRSRHRHDHRRRH